MFTGPYDTGTDPAFTHGPSYAPDGGYPAHSMVASGATSIRRTPTKKDVERAHKMTNLPNAGQAQHAIHQTRRSASDLFTLLRSVTDHSQRGGCFYPP